jgi:hypothetical protein
MLRKALMAVTAAGALAVGVGAFAAPADAYVRFGIYVGPGPYYYGPYYGPYYRHYYYHSYGPYYGRWWWYHHHPYYNHYHYY